MNLKLPEVVAPLSIYNCCSTRKTFWEEKFTLGELTPLKIENYSCLNVKKHREIKDSDKFIILCISLKFVSLDNMRITSSDPKDHLGISGKGLITSIGLKSNVRSKK